SFFMSPCECSAGFLSWPKARTLNNANTMTCFIFILFLHVILFACSSQGRHSKRASIILRMPSKHEASKQVQAKIDELRESIRHHEHLYYVLDAPAISDGEYDKLYNQLKKLEAENPELIMPDSPTQRVGGRPAEGFAKVTHSRPMLSLDNAYNEEELRDWERRVHDVSGHKSVEYVCELKLDGMSMALIYTGGALAHGVARGDGTVGEDVTTNVRTVRSVPLSIAAATLKEAGLPPNFEVRGEIIMLLESFRKLNEERERLQLPKFANPRNFAAGTIRTMDANIVAQRRLEFFSYF